MAATSGSNTPRVNEESPLVETSKVNGPKRPVQRTRSSTFQRHPLYYSSRKKPRRWPLVLRFIKGTCFLVPLDQIRANTLTSTRCNSRLCTPTSATSCGLRCANCLSRRHQRWTSCTTQQYYTKSVHCRWLNACVPQSDLVQSVLGRQ